jgi:hypothetical protein
VDCNVPYVSSLLIAVDEAATMAYILLEIISLQEVFGLYDLLYPSILQKRLPESLLYCLKSSLEEDPRKRTSFQEMYKVLASDTDTFDDVEDQSGALELLEDGVNQMMMNDPLIR